MCCAPGVAFLPPNISTLWPRRLSGPTSPNGTPFLPSSPGRGTGLRRWKGNILLAFHPQNRWFSITNEFCTKRCTRQAKPPRTASAASGLWDGSTKCCTVTEPKNRSAGSCLKKNEEKCCVFSCFFSDVFDLHG